jgi:hypothetical protein
MKAARCARRQDGIVYGQLGGADSRVSFALSIVLFRFIAR